MYSVYHLPALFFKYKAVKRKSVGVKLILVIEPEHAQDREVNKRNPVFKLL